MTNHLFRPVTAALLAAILTPSVTAAADGNSDGDATWSLAVPVSEVNSTTADGCPIESADGRSLYFASTRPGGVGGNDIWVAHRRRQRDAWALRNGWPSRSTRPPTTSARPHSRAGGCCSSPSDRATTHATPAQDSETSTPPASPASAHHASRNTLDASPKATARTSTDPSSAPPS
jgi:hypothetical protein